MELKKTKPPKTNIINPDYKRRVVSEGPSSDSGDDAPQPKLEANKVEQEKGNKVEEEKGKLVEDAAMEK